MLFARREDAQQRAQGARQPVSYSWPEPKIEAEIFLSLQLKD
jgi:hypothetical protein